MTNESPPVGLQTRRDEPYHATNAELDPDARSWQSEQLCDFLKAQNHLLTQNHGMLVCEPSMHDMLMRLPVAQNIPDELWSIDEDETVRHAHLMFHDAGADISLTNTRAATRLHLDYVSHTLTPQLFAKAATQQAYSSAPLFVLGQLGPSALNVALHKEESRIATEELAQALLDCGVHGLLFDGISSAIELDLVLGANYRRENRALIVGFKLDKEGRLSDGLSVLDALELAAEKKCNCLSLGNLGFDEALSLTKMLWPQAQAHNISLAVNLSWPDTTELYDSKRLEEVVAHLATQGVSLISVAPGMGLGALSKLAEAVALAVGSIATQEASQ